MADNHGAESSATVSITVAGVNDAPVAVDDAVALDDQVISERVVLDFNGSVNLSDYLDYAFTGFTHYVSGLGDGDNTMAYTYYYNNVASLNGADGAILRADGDDFSLDGFRARSYTRNHDVTVLGYDDGALVASQALSLTPSYQTFTFGGAWSSVDEVRFDMSASDYSYTFLDNIDLLHVEGPNEDDVVDVDVLANDYDVDANDTITLTSFDGTSVLGASVSRNADGTLRYDPTASATLQALALGESSSDTFTYTIADNHGATDTAIVTVEVAGRNDAPIAAPDAATTDEDAAVTIAVADLLANDSDVDASDTISIASFDSTSALGAAVSLNPDGTLHYDPTASSTLQALALGESTSDMFTYTIADNHGATDTATVTVEVAGVNDAPVANPDTGGQVVLDFNGSVNLSDYLDYAFTGFTHYVSGLGDGDNTMAYTYYYNNVASLNGADGAILRADGDDFSLDGFRARSYTRNHDVTVLGYDDGALVASQALSLTPSYQTFTFGGAWSSVDEVRFDMSASDYSYTFLDNVALSQGRTEDDVVDVDVLANDYDVDANDTITLTSFDGTSVLGASVSRNVDGTLRYDPTASATLQALALGESSSDTFTYTIADSHGATDTATVTVEVAGVNDDPVIGVGVTAGAVTEIADPAQGENETAHTVTGTIAFADVDLSDRHTVSVTPQGEGYRGTLGVVAVDSTGSGAGAIGWTFEVADSALDDLAADETRVQTYEIAVDDGHGGIATEIVSMTLTGTNDAPEAIADEAATDQDTPVTIDVLANDTDVDNGDDPTTFTLDDASVETGQGSVSIVDNQLVFDPGDDFDDLPEGEARFVTVNYTMSDAAGAASSATVTITVTGTNDAPIAVADTAATDEDTPVTVDVLANDTDIDDPHAFSLVGVSVTAGLGTVTIVDDKLVYDPGDAYQYLGDGESASVELTYTMSDEHGQTSSNTVTLTVDGANDAEPVYVNQVVQGFGTNGSYGGYGGSGAYGYGTRPGGTGGTGAQGGNGGSGTATTANETVQGDAVNDSLVLQTYGYGGYGGNGDVPISVEIRGAGVAG